MGDADSESVILLPSATFTSQSSEMHEPLSFKSMLVISIIVTSIFIAYLLDWVYQSISRAVALRQQSQRIRTGYYLVAATSLLLPTAYFSIRYYLRLRRPKQTWLSFIKSKKFLFTSAGLLLACVPVCYFLYTKSPLRQPQPQPQPQPITTIIPDDTNTQSGNGQPNTIIFNRQESTINPVNQQPEIISGQSTPDLHQSDPNLHQQQDNNDQPESPRISVTDYPGPRIRYRSSTTSTDSNLDHAGGSASLPLNIIRDNRIHKDQRSVSQSDEDEDENEGQDGPPILHSPRSPRFQRPYFDNENMEIPTVEEDQLFRHHLEKQTTLPLNSDPSFDDDDADDEPWSPTNDHHYHPHSHGNDMQLIDTENQENQPTTTMTTTALADSYVHVNDDVHPPDPFKYTSESPPLPSSSEPKSSHITGDNENLLSEDEDEQKSNGYDGRSTDGNSDGDDEGESEDEGELSDHQSPDLTSHVGGDTEGTVVISSTSDMAVPHPPETNMETATTMEIETVHTPSLSYQSSQQPPSYSPPPLSQNELVDTTIVVPSPASTDESVPPPVELLITAPVTMEKPEVSGSNASSEEFLVPILSPREEEKDSSDTTNISLGDHEMHAKEVPSDQEAHENLHRNNEQIDDDGEWDDDDDDDDDDDQGSSRSGGDDVPNDFQLTDETSPQPHQDPLLSYGRPLSRGPFDYYNPNDWDKNVDDAGHWPFLSPPHLTFRLEPPPVPEDMHNDNDTDENNEDKDKQPTFQFLPKRISPIQFQDLGEKSLVNEEPGKDNTGYQTTWINQPLIYNQEEEQEQQYPSITTQSNDNEDDDEGSDSSSSRYYTLDDDVTEPSSRAGLGYQFQDQNRDRPMLTDNTENKSDDNDDAHTTDSSPSPQTYVVNLPTTIAHVDEDSQRRDDPSTSLGSNTDSDLSLPSAAPNQQLDDQEKKEQH